MMLDDESWHILKEKALQHYFDHRKSQKTQGFFNQLNEAFAYRYLVNKGFKNIRFIKEDKNKRPDIEYSECLSDQVNLLKINEVNDKRGVV